MNLNTDADTILSEAAKWLLRLNPTLLQNPPPITESSGNDICYQDPIVYCKDLPFGMRGVVGSWFLSPNRIMIETIVILSIAILILSIVKPFIPSARIVSRPSKLMRLATATIFTLQLLYKLCGYPGKILVMVMPCNVLWILNMIISFYGINARTPSQQMIESYSNIVYYIIQIQFSYTALVFVALLNPDFSDTVLFGEVYFYYIHHFFLLYYIIHYLFINGQVSTMDIREKYGNHNGSLIVHQIISFLQWVLISCCYFAIFYFGIVTPLSIYSGLNLNYMLHPPPNQDDLVGEWYRIMSIVYCAISFTVMRFILVLIEIVWRKIVLLVKKKNS